MKPTKLRAVATSRPVRPQSSHRPAIVFGPNGNLYGTTQASYSGTSNDGTVFEIVNGNVVTLGSFNGTNGSVATGQLVVDSAGDVFGTTSFGGADGDGEVYEIQAGSGTITPLLTFNGASGSTPSSGLTADGSGNLYGITSGGGASGDGTIYEISGAMSGSGGSSFATLANGTLTLTGTAGADSISVTDNAGSVTAFLNGTASQAFTGVNAISVAGGAGSDTITLV